MPIEDLREQVKKVLLPEFGSSAQLFHFIRHRWPRGTGQANASRRLDTPAGAPLVEAARRVVSPRVSEEERVQEARRIRPELLKIAKEMFPRIWEETQSGPPEDAEESFVRKLLDHHTRFPVGFGKKMFNSLISKPRYENEKIQDFVIDPEDPLIREMVLGTVSGMQEEPKDARGVQKLFLRLAELAMFLIERRGVDKGSLSFTPLPPSVESQFQNVWFFDERQGADSKCEMFVPVFTALARAAGFPTLPQEDVEGHPTVRVFVPEKGWIRAGWPEVARIFGNDWFSQKVIEISKKHQGMIHEQMGLRKAET